MRTWLLALALLCAGLTASGCLLTRRLIEPTRLPPESYGEFLGVERRGGPGEDLFIYRLERHTGAKPGYYAVQPAAEPRTAPPEIHWLEWGHTISSDALDTVPVLQPRGRDPGPATHDPDRPAYRIVRLSDRLGREHHGYDRWSPGRKRWVRLGSCAMGTRRYEIPEHPATIILLLPFTAAIDTISAPIQFFILIGRQVARDIVRGAADAATAAAIGAAHRRVRKRMR